MREMTLSGLLRKLKCLASKVAFEPIFHAVDYRASALDAMDRVTTPAEQQQADARRMDRVADDVHESADALRQAEPHRRMEYFLGELDDPVHLGAAARKHDAGSDLVVEA